MSPLRKTGFSIASSSTRFHTPTGHSLSPKNTPLWNCLTMMTTISAMKTLSQSQHLFRRCRNSFQLISDPSILNPDQQVETQPPRWPIHPLPDPIHEVHESPSSPGTPSPTGSLHATIATALPAPSRHGGCLPKPTERKAQSEAGAKIAFSLASDKLYEPSFSPPLTPRTLNEAMASPYAVQWTKAINDELRSLDKNNTFKLVHRPQHQRVVKSAILLTIRDAESLTPQFKAHFVGKGYTQIHSVDYDKTFASVIKSTWA